jgi:succinate dehydrogenase flavin-adding protein (antitoxin of CptAB toxin-antitoxin module)
MGESMMHKAQKSEFDFLINATDNDMLEWEAN